jgi:poly(A) polymerase
LQPIPAPHNPLVVSRADHPISRKQISPAALKVLYRLRDAGHQAYLVGGGVRDLLLGREPKDFDVATDARPEQVKKLFNNCRLIGRRFLLAHVRYGAEIIEVATFRAAQGPEREVPDDEFEDEEGAPEETLTHDDSGRILRDNVYGTLEEDAWRRDFSVNALYYNIDDFSVVDYTGGYADLKEGVLRLIGDPEMRYREDPVRMLRAVRFAVKLGFRLHPDTEAPIRRLAPLLRDIPPARLFEEVLKLFLSGFGAPAFHALRHHGLFEHLFESTERTLAVEHDSYPITFVTRALENTDARVQADKPVTPAFLFAALLWEPVCDRAGAFIREGMNEIEALKRAGEDLVERQVKQVAVPRRFAVPMKEIFELQPRFRLPAGKRAQRLLTHPRFRAAYDFFAIRAQAGEGDPAVAAAWARLAAMPIDQALAEIAKQPVPEGAPGEGGRKRRRRRGGRGRKKGTPAGSPPPE